MDDQHRILIVADSFADAELAQREVRPALPACVFEQTQTAEAYLAAIERFRPSLIITSLQRPFFDNMAALHLACQHAPLTPLVILAESTQEDAAIACVQAGAADYVLKQYPKRLGMSVSRAITERRLRDEHRLTEEALRASESHFRSLYENASIGLYRTTPDGRVLMANPAMVRMLGYASFEALAKIDLEEVSPASGQPRGVFRTRLERDGVVVGLEDLWRRADGSLIVIRESARAIRDEQGVVCYYDGTVEDITEQRSMQEALHLTQFYVDHASVGIMRTGSDARILSVNNEMCRLLGYTREELLDMRIVDIDPNFPIERWALHRYKLRAHGSDTFETTHRRKDGKIVAVEITNSYLEFRRSGFSISFIRDISDRKRAEEAQAQLEQQLRQAQKMESIGQLAGGVAHDFNNLLTVIQGYCDLIEGELSPSSLLRNDLGQIRMASQRASALTRQLLAFSRKQILRPHQIVVNDLVANMCAMLDRLIGEDITLRTTLAPDLYPVLADPGQIEQVIMNLVLNARDAMPTGGTLMIETSNIQIDQSYADSHPEAPVGPCVILTVIDTGHGMDEITQARIFEPFFTTKELGKGTGLGLATVYGIVKQSGGEITVMSNPEQGSTFHILLPASPGAANSQLDSGRHIVVTWGSETILLVEDDALVRNLARTVLRREGYTVLEAANGPEALEIAHQHRGRINLLVTDVVMPQMSGRELAEQLSRTYQQIKVLFMSGYTDDLVVRHGLMTARVNFLAKPFSSMRLAAKVREVLDNVGGTPFQSAKTYYEDARHVLTRTLDVANGAANTRSFAQAMLAQGNVLGMMGNLTMASDLFTSGQSIFQALGDRSGQTASIERLGWIARERGDVAAATSLLEESIALNRKLGDNQQLAWALLTLAGVAILREDAASAEALITQGIALSPESYDWLGWSLNHLGHAAQLRRDYDRAEHLHQRTLTVFIERLGDKSTGVMWAYQGLGEAALGKGNSTLAQRWLCDSLRLSHKLGAQIMIAWCLAGLGGAAAQAEAPERAARLWGAAEQLRTRLNCRSAPATRDTYERLLELARAQLDADVFADAWEAGGSLPLEQAIAEALPDEDYSTEQNA